MESTVLVIGESVVDVVRTGDRSDREFPGGSGANAAVALSRLGRSVRLATAFADDEYGALLARHLATNGVDLAADPGSIGHTSSAVALIGVDRAATYTLDVDWALNPLLPDGPPPVAVHITSLAPVLAPGCYDVVSWVAALRESATITYDVNFRAIANVEKAEGVRRVERMAAFSDVVQASDEDLTSLWPHLGIEGAAARLLDLGAVAVLITRGADGASYLTPQHRGDLPAVEVDVVDTIGAGDTFAAGLIDALAGRGLLGAGRRDALRAAGSGEWGSVGLWAARAAGATVSRPGADPPWLSELVDIRE